MSPNIMQLHKQKAAHERHLRRLKVFKAMAADGGHGCWEMKEFKADAERFMSLGLSLNDIDNLVAQAVEIIKENEEELAKLDSRPPGSVMTPLLNGMRPSSQVAKSDDDRSLAEAAFNDCVETVDSIVGDVCILHSWLIANRVKPYNHDIGPANMPKELHRVSDGKLHRYLKGGPEIPWTEHEKLTEMARIASNALNDNGKECEDARSGQFAALWNANYGRDIVAWPQMVTMKDKNSMYKADVVLARVLESGNVNEGKIVGDCCVIIEWQCDRTEGAEREGSCYALHLCDVTKRRKFLVLTVSEDLVEVFGLYCIKTLNTGEEQNPREEHQARLVKLDEAFSLEAFLEKWLPALIWFVRQSSGDYAPAVPRFDSKAIESTPLNMDVYKVSFRSGVKDRVYKVYDYVNRRNIAKEDRRWMNFKLVQKFYPQEEEGIEAIISTDKLEIFSYPYLEGKVEEIHLPKTKEQFIVVGEALKKLHEEDNYIHGDVRLANMLFHGQNGAYLIDFDFARLEEPESKYVQGYCFSDLPRHKDARAGMPMKKIHDVFSYWVCYLFVCGTSEDEWDLPDHVETMEELLSYIRNDDRTVDGNVRRCDIPELTVNTGTTRKKRVEVNTGEGVASLQPVGASVRHLNVGQRTSSSTVAASGWHRPMQRSPARRKPRRAASLSPPASGLSGVPETYFDGDRKQPATKKRKATDDDSP